MKCRLVGWIWHLSNNKIIISWATIISLFSLVLAYMPLRSKQSRANSKNASQKVKDSKGRFVVDNIANKTKTTSKFQCPPVTSNREVYVVIGVDTSDDEEVLIPEEVGGEDVINNCENLSWLGYDKTQTSVRDTKEKYLLHGQCGGQKGLSRTSFYNCIKRKRLREEETLNNLYKKTQHTLDALWTRNNFSTTNSEDEEVVAVTLDTDGLGHIKCNTGVSPRKTYKIALRMLLNNVNLHAKAGRCQSKKRKKVTKKGEASCTATDFDRRRLVAVCRYLDVFSNGYEGKQYNKMNASALIAHIIYGKKGTSSHKARCIRAWAPSS